MKNVVKNYLSNAKIKEISYSEIRQFTNSWLKENPSVYIPSWNYLKSNNLEIVIKNYYAILIKKNDLLTIMTNSGSSEIKITSFLSFLRKFEKLWSGAKSGSRLFYLGIIAYDMTAMEPHWGAFDYYQLPDAFLLIPGEAAVINHSQQIAYLITAQETFSIPETLNLSKMDFQEDEVKVNEKKEDYLKKIKQIQNLILNGEVYQINYAIRFSRWKDCQGFLFFKRLYELNPAPFSFYAKLPHCELYSVSPERFLMVEQHTVTTEPIKGTIRRGINSEEDNVLKKRLINSEKDAAELSMIVDLLRNDLSKSCLPGTVNVDAHKRLESYPNVHHLVSTITAELSDGRNFVDVLAAAFPGGSITGCPKIAAMKYIRQLEQHNRSFYTGSFFIRFPISNQFDSNILIRTAICKDNIIHFQAGGGIVYDSEGEAEYEECLAKTDSFLKI